MLRPVFHLTVVVLNLYSLWYDQMYLDFPYPNDVYAKLPFKGRQVFLTIWCFILQTLYFSISLLNDFVGTNAPESKRIPLIRSIKDNLFSFAFPVALYVSTAFWVLYTVDKELVFPDYIERNFPIWLNHTLHTFVSIFILIEIYITNRNYPSRNFGLCLTVVFSLVYVIWMHIIFSRAGIWPYPILDKLNLVERMLYFTVSAAFEVGFYILGEKLHYTVSTRSTVPYVNGHMKKKL